MSDVLEGLMKSKRDTIDHEEEKQEEKHRQLLAATLAAGLLANPNITDKHPQLEALFRDCRLQVEKILG